MERSLEYFIHVFLTLFLIKRKNKLKYSCDTIILLLEATKRIKIEMCEMQSF